MTKDWTLHRDTGLPRATHDKEYFHKLYWTKFAKGCVPPWLQMTPPQKRERVHAFLFQKFTLDPQGGVMFPRTPQKRKQRNEACWPEFWLSDQELEGIVTQVMTAYYAGCT